MISPPLLGALKKLGALEDSHELGRVGMISIGTYDARALVDAVETLTMLRKLVESDEATELATRTLLTVKPGAFPP